MTIKGNGVSTPMPRTNWNQTDPTKADYLKGREDLARAIQDVQDNLESLTYSDVGAAPAGYGLGLEEPEKRVYDLNDAVETGTYWYGAGTLNAPNNSGEWVHTESYSSRFKHQTAFVSYTGGNIAERWMTNGVWQPWEWVNPPMAFGVEYRTTDRWNGKPVYKQAVFFGGISAGTTNTWDVSDRKIKECLDISLINQAGALINRHPGVSSYKFEPTYVEVVTSGIVGASVYAILTFTKTTD